MSETVPFTSTLTVTRALVPGQNITARSTPPNVGPWDRPISVMITSVPEPSKSLRGSGVELVFIVPVGFPFGDYTISVTSKAEDTTGTVVVGDAP